MDNNSKYLSELSTVVAKIDNKSVAKEFLTNILTPSELDEVAKRLQIVKLLKKGVPQRDIAKKLDVSIATITRGSRELKYGVKGFDKIL